MATYINVFVDTDQPAALTAAAISAMLGKELLVTHSDVGEIYRTHLMSVHVALFGEHGLEDVNDTDFSRYSIEIDLGPLCGDRFHDELVRSLALDLAWQIHQRMERQTMVTYDVQKVLFRFSA